MTMTSTSNTATAAVNELASGLADMARDGIFAPIAVGSGGISSDGSKDAIEANHSDYLSGIICGITGLWRLSERWPP